MPTQDFRHHGGVESLILRALPLSPRLSAPEDASAMLSRLAGEDQHLLEELQPTASLLFGARGHRGCLLPVSASCGGIYEGWRAWQSGVPGGERLGMV